jgi:hypothetical protein
MPHFGTPDEGPSPIAGDVEPVRADELAQLVFIGGTGRSGTHVLAQLISRHHRYGLVPVEVRFHTDADGFPGLLSGEVTPEQFLKRLRGFWWKGFQTRRFRGMYRFVERERFDAAVERFEKTHGDDLEAACRTLFYDLLWFRTEGGGGTDRGLVEQSTDNIAAAPTLARLFPEAKFIHVVRDGRDASASRVSQTRGIVRPRTRIAGIAWWEERLRAIEAGADAIPEGKLLTVGLDELVRMSCAAAAVPVPGDDDDETHPPLLLKPHDDRGSEQGALARGDLEAKGGADRGAVPRNARPSRERRYALSTAPPTRLRAPG